MAKGRRYRSEKKKGATQTPLGREKKKRKTSQGERRTARAKPGRFFKGEPGAKGTNEVEFGEKVLEKKQTMRKKRTDKRNASDRTDSGR